MNGIDPGDTLSSIERIRDQAVRDEFRVTVHAHQEMVEEDIKLNEVIEAINEGQILENYPDHRRGPCCLINGRTAQGRALHVVCSRPSIAYNNYCV